MTPANWASTTIRALEDLWAGFIEFIPQLIGALIVFIVGWFVSLGIGRLITEVLRKLKFNELFEGGSWGRALDKSDVKVDPAKFIGELFKWIVLIVFLLAVAEILQLTQFAEFVQQILTYLPNVVASAFIFVVAVIVADFANKIVSTAVEGMRVEYADLAGSIVKWAIWIFAIFAILTQLGVATSLIQTLFTGIIAVLVISFGLAFGLGGKEVARDILENFRNRLRR